MEPKPEITLGALVIAGILAAGCAHGGAATNPARPSSDPLASRWCDGRDYQPKSATLAAQDATLELGQAYYCLGYTYASAAVFDRIVHAGPAHKEHNEALKALVALSHRLPRHATALADLGDHLYSSRIAPPGVEKDARWMDPEAAALGERVLSQLAAAKHVKVDLEQSALAEIRDDLALIAGARRYEQGRLADALTYFALIPPASPLYVRAKLFEGATHVREYHSLPAVAAFADAARASVTSAAPNSGALQDLAIVSLSRLYYSCAAYDLAVKHYAHVSPNSVDWADSLYESAWAYFMANQPARALERLAAFRAEDARKPARPDSVAEASVLRAVIEMDLATAAHDSRKPAEIPMAEISQVFTQVKALIFEKFSEPSDESDSAGGRYRPLSFEQARKLRDGAAGLSPPATRAARAALLDRSVGKRFAYVDLLSDELTRLDAAPAAWRNSPAGTWARAAIADERERAMASTADLASRRLRRFTDELAQLIKHVIAPETDDPFARPDQVGGGL